MELHLQPKPAAKYAKKARLVEIAALPVTKRATNPRAAPATGDCTFLHVTNLVSSDYMKRRTDPVVLEAAFLAFLLYIPMGYFILQMLLAFVGL